MSATVLLPRREVIVRQVTLPRVAVSDKEGAIRFQLDTLHPYRDAEVCRGWSALPGAAVPTPALERMRVAKDKLGRQEGRSAVVRSSQRPTSRPVDVRSRMSDSEPFADSGSIGDYGATSGWEPLGRQGRSIALTHGLEFPRLSACGNGTARRSVVFLRSSKLSDEDTRSEWRLV